MGVHENARHFLASPSRGLWPVRGAGLFLLPEKEAAMVVGEPKQAPREGISASRPPPSRACCILVVIAWAYFAPGEGYLWPACLFFHFRFRDAILGRWCDGRCVCCPRLLCAVGSQLVSHSVSLVCYA